MSTLSKLAQYNNNRGVAPTSVGVASKKESTSTLGKLQNYAQQAAEEQARAAQAAAEGEKNNGGFFGGLGYLGEKIGLGFLSGIEGIWDYTAGGLAKLFGADDWAERQFANDWVNYSHADEWYNPSDGWKVAGDVAGGIGTSLPAIAGVAAAAAIAYFSGGSLSGVSAGIISGVVAGLGAAGNATKEAYRETGELGGKEFGYGALSGITEGAVEGLSAGIGAGTGAIVKNISKSFGKEVAKTTAKAAARETFGKAIIKGFVGEAFEEGLSEFLDPYWKRLTYDPEAKNATAQEIGYAALIGGLSGAIMGGFDATVRNTSNTIRGNNIVNKGTATDVITTAENIANSDIYADQYESFGAVKNILNELQTSMQKTDGEIRTVKQKMLLGYLERANTYTVFEPMVQKNAARIVANADAIAERLNTYGYTDAQGKPITYTAEQIRAGIDTNNPKSYAKALKTNNILRTLAVVDATGQLYMDTKKFEAATLRGETLSSQVDLNRFIETASQEELHSVAEKLDIADWQGLTNEQFKEKIVAFAERGGIEEYQTEQRTNADIKAAADAVDVQKAKAKIPQKFTAKKDGVTRYTQGGVDMAVIKNGDSYRIYDYESGKLSKPLTLQQVNERLTEIRGRVDSIVNTAAVESITTEESRQAAEIDAYAAENISAYSKLSDANKSLVRGVIRQARAAGISEADSLSYARVAAHAGINISFDKQAKVGDIEILKVGTDESGNAIYADGVYFPETNSIYVNPEAKRSQERLLIHELTHAIFTTSDGKVFLMDGVEKMSAAEKETIIKRYVEAGHGGTVEIIDEINAHFAEGQLQNKKLLKRLTEEKPSFKQKILSFFKKSSSEYNSDERLSGAAKKLYKQYKKMFDSFVAENQHNNAFEPVKISEAEDSSRMVLSETFERLGKYSDSEIESIETTKLFQVARSYADVKKFIEAAQSGNIQKRLFLGKITSETAAKILAEANIDVEGKSIALSSDDIRHIFARHGENGTALRKGDIAVTQENFENIIETLIEPDSVSRTDQNGVSGIMFQKEINGKITAITVVSGKKKALTLKSAWITKLKQATSQSLNAETLSSTSETLPRIKPVSNNSISENTEKVNTTQAKKPKNVKYALPEDVSNLLFDDEFYKEFENEDRTHIKETVEELEKIKASEKYANMSFEESYDINAKLRALKAGYNSLYDYYVGKEKQRLTDDYEYSVKHGTSSRALSIVERKQAQSAKNKQLQADIAAATPLQNAQFKVIQETNPMFNDTSVGIRSPKEILTFAETVNDSESFNWGDFSREDAKRALKKGTITVYSSYPIKNGVFVSTSYRQALDYASGDPSGVHSRKVALDSVAWINGDEGQYAKVYKKNPRYALPDSVETDVVQEYGKTYRWNETGYLLVDGSRLNLSGEKQGGRSGYRVLDHRDIFDMYSDIDGSDAMIEFMSRGNIRVIPESPAINLQIEPTEAQYRQIQSLVETLGWKNKEFTVDFDNQYGDTVDSLSYNGNVSARKVVADIQYYFKEGKIPYQSELSQFRYALTDEQGEALRKRNVSGDRYLDAEDLAYEIMAYGGRITSDAKAVLYHGTTAEAAAQIRKTGKMIGKEPNLHFSTKKDGVVLDYGKSVVEVKIPLEKLKMNDIFDDELHLTMEVRPNTLTNVKFALPETDSTGQKLSQQQREFFSKSKVVDGNGQLLKVYHGSKASPTVFENRYISNWNAFGKGFYFTEDRGRAQSYAKPSLYECYLNITNPFVTNDRASLDLLYKSINNTQQDIAEYSSEKGIGGSEFWQISNYLDDIGKDVSKFIRELGFDGIIHDSYGVKEFVVYDSNQIKLASNKTPTVNSDIRFALDDSDRDVRGNYTAGQRAKFAANNTAMKVYSRSDAESVISAIMDERLTFDDGKYGVLAGKNRTEVVDYLFKKLNTVKEGYRIGVALKIADYLIDNTTLSDMYAAETVSESMRTLSVLRYYMHKMDLSGIQSEIKHRYDNKNTINLLWAAPKGEKGIAPDTLAQSLESDAIFLSGWNEADMFFEMVDMYESARRDVQESVQQQSLKDYGGKEQLEKLRQDIARDILLAYDNKGTKSKYAKLVEKYTTQIQSLKQQVREANSYNRLVNSVVDKAQRMRDLKLGTFLNSTQYKNDVFKSSIEGLARIKNRGNFNIAGTRKILADLRTWYTTDNPILADTYEQGVADMLDSLSAGNKRFTKEELVTLNNVMAYFTKYVENFNKVYKNGKWVEAIPEATKYIDTIHANSELKVGLFRKLAGTTYMQTFGDPMTVARRMDMYEPNGFYTETLQQLRDAAVDSQIAEMEIMSNYDTFMKKNKKYLAQITKKTVPYGGKDIPRSVLIGLYMTLKRQHAQAGLAQNGFAYVDTDGKRVRVDGFAPNIETDAELYFSVVEEQKKIESLLSAADKEYIAILEQAYNNDAKKLKADRDMQRLGFTNATEDYYYPIRRGNIAKNVDTSDVQGEIDRVSNSSFNKDTVRGAKQELFIESADTVFKRHIHAVCQYAFLSPAIETYNRIFNLDVSGNPNKPVSVATESANTWAKGNKYFSKLISDIQGIPTSSGEGNKVLGFIRGNYAKFQLGANPKVWVTQLSSLFASSSILDADSITKGMFVSAKDVDTYCSLAKLRNNDNTAALAQGVLDKLGKVSDVLMAPIGKMDRFVVCRLFGACQAQVAKNGGAKIGTEANKIAAGQLLRRVILETQQNSVATERSAAMRSGNEILRTVTMFTADSMKVVGRVIDSIGELSTLKAKLKATSNADVRATLQKSIKLANRKVRKSVTSLVTSALFMAAVAQLFSWLYNKDKKDDESTAQTVLVDFLGNLIGGLPVIKDIYARIAQGYDFSNYAYSSINDLLDSSINLVEAAKNLVSGDASQQDIAKGVKNLSYSLGQMFGVPTRNIYNVAYGLTKRISPVSAYKIDNQFYKKNYVSDLNKALENDDAEMVSYIMSLIYNQRIGDMINEETRQKLSDLYAKGYSILPRSIGDSIRYEGNEIEMNDAQKKRFMSIYSQANRYIEKLLASSGYGKLSEKKQAKAVKSIYDAFYYQAISDLVGQDANNTLGELSRYIAIEKLAVVFSGLSEIASDVDSKGNTVSGSRKKNTVAYLLKQNLSDGERLLIMCYRGYSIQDGDYKGYTEQRAKIILLKYILSLKVTQAEKAKIAAECGFTVKNGKIDRSSLYSGVGSLSKKNK